MSKQPDNTTIYSTDDLLKYATGNMPAAEMYALERAALDDDLLADAMEGYRAMVQQGQADGIPAILAALPAPALDTTTPVVRMRWVRRISYAAAAVLVAGAGWWILSLQGSASTTESAEPTEAVAMEVPPPAAEANVQEAGEKTAAAPPPMPAIAAAPKAQASKIDQTAAAPATGAAPVQAAPPAMADFGKNNAVANVPLQEETTEKKLAAADAARQSVEAARSVATLESRKMAAAPASAKRAAPAGITIVSPAGQLLPVPATDWDTLLTRLKAAAGNHTSDDSLQLRFTVQPAGTIHKPVFSGAWSAAGKAAVMALLQKNVPFTLAEPADTEVILHWY